MTDLFPLATTAEEQQRGAAVAVLPIGSFEQHGAHLPLATDAIIAATLAKAVADTYPVLRLPPLTISCSHEHAAWAGTVSISARTLHAVVTDVAASLSASGVGRLVLVNGHGGNYVLSNVVQESAGSMALFPGVADWQAAHTAAGLRTSLDDDMHAGELETSILLHAHPHLVRPGHETADHVTDRDHLLTLGLRAYTESGVVGRPSLATAAKGHVLLDTLVQRFAGVLEALGA
ncbi:creatininase family protein [Amycolatopsis sp. cmx-4-68]|uniref:creatininase family protein n=1 Tax=Amycolatopsis sp. cmx-4-68 TaxID=2790938 RepID=UPI00397E3766